MPDPRSPATGSSVLEDLPFCLARASIGFRRLCDQTLRAVGLPPLAPGAASILHALEEENDCTVNRLVERTHLPNGTLTGLLDELAKAGYLERHPNPNDGRSWLIGLTARGHQFCHKLKLRHGVVMEVFAEVLSAPEQAELGRLLTKLTEQMRGYRSPVGATRASPHWPASGKSRIRRIVRPARAATQE
ncbi:MAG TPA: MarR family transcriptional regulator [Candidatus Didemnitutus sp.]|nr:MarR family transcriptional regulator [Candidatus Didemnitutus sp.]